MKERKSERGKNDEVNGQGGKRGAPAQHGADWTGQGTEENSA